MEDHKNLDNIFTYENEDYYVTEKTSLLDNVHITNHHYVIVYNSV